MSHHISREKKVTGADDRTGHGRRSKQRVTTHPL